VVAIPQDIRLTGLFGFGIFMGVVFFFKGFRSYREFRTEEDIPEIPIRSIPLGLVHVHGEAQAGSEGQMVSPVGRTPCLCYKVDIDHWSGNGDRGNWRHWKTAWGGAPFVLSDSTGEVMIDGRGAELMVGRNTRAVAGSRMGQAIPVDDDDPYARDYPEAAQSASDQATLPEGPPGDDGLVEFAEAAPGGGLGGACGYYRLTEYVILPGGSYDVVGTYADNPASLDDLDRAAALKDPTYKPPAAAAGAPSDRKIIAKGTNDPTFLISGEDAKGTQAELKNRAFLQVFGGAALMIVCLALLLGQFGLLR
jgi:hypothetical protein